MIALILFIKIKPIFKCKGALFLTYIFTHNSLLYSLVFYSIVSNTVKACEAYVSEYEK